MGIVTRSSLGLNSITAGVETTSVNGSPQTATTYGRNGGYGLRINNTGAQENVTFDFSASNQNGVYFCRIYFKPVAYGTGICDFIRANSTAAVKVTARLKTDGKLQIWNAEDNVQVGSDSASSLALNSYHCIEIKIDTTTISSTICELRVAGSTWCSGTANLAAGINRFSFGHSAADATFDAYYSDIGVNDTSGSGQSSWLGPGGLAYLRPNGAGDNNAFTVQIGGTAGSSNNYTRVNEVIPDDATSYNGDALSGDIDDFNIDDTPSAIAANDVINAVLIGVRYRSVVAATEAAFKLRAKKTSGGTVSLSAEITPNSITWKTNANAAPWLYPLVLYTDPDGNPWTKASLDSAQIGYLISTTNINAANISAIWMLVDYTPVSTKTNFLQIFR